VLSASLPLATSERNRKEVTGMSEQETQEIPDAPVRDQADGATNEPETEGDAPATESATE
jgi:hypothetical protein